MTAETMKTPHIPLAGVIGDPVAHSRSPAVHGFWLRHYGLPGFYVPMEVKPGDLAAVLATLPKAGFVGCNITIPHKEAALALAAKATERARRIGAANTLTFLPGGGFEADNTDGYGFIANLRAGAPGWVPEAAPAAVIGAGGAARAIVDALLEAGVPELRLANRTRARAEILASAFGSRVTVCDWGDPEALFSGVGVAVNTTSLGMVGKAPFELPLDALPGTAVATDCVYTPLETGFLRGAKARGCVTVDGLGMLLHQAVPGFERWFGQRPEVTEALRQATLAA